MKKIFIIAHTWQGVELTIETIESDELAVKHLATITDDGFRQPYDNETADDYYSNYLFWVRNDNDNQCDNSIVLEIIEIDITFKTV